MLDDINVVLASNRGPISFVAHQDSFATKRGAGGAAPTLDLVARRLGERAAWIAAATSEADRAALRSGAVDEVRHELGYDLYLLDIDEDTYSRYYDLVSNRLLWFANHCLFDETGSDPGAELDAWRAYVAVNDQMASCILEIAEPDALVMFQDYHLAVAPRLLRRRRPQQTIFHFTHSSFCANGLLRLGSEIAEEVVDGMLGADLLGFHTQRWVEEFLAACEALGRKVDARDGAVEVDGRRTWVRAYPIPVDAEKLRERARADRVQEWIERLDGDDILLVRADRSEPSKNIVRGFEAFGSLLDRRDDLRGRIRFIACLYPSRQSMAEYREYAQRVRSTVAAINKRHPGAIDLYFEDDFDRTLAALTIYDVLLVNSLMDGMNLVSKEGPTVNRRDGAVVLSKGAGSFGQIGRFCVQISDPRDVDQTTRAIERAIEMGEDERRQNAAGLRSAVEGRTPVDWMEEQLEDLMRVSRKEAPG